MLVMGAPKGVSVPSLGRIRMQRALSQDDLAKRAKLGRSTIARLEGGQVARYVTIRKLAAALRVEPEDLMRPPA